jgi:hypothetical protein
VTYPMILAPLFVLVLMTFALGIFLAVLRGPPLMRGDIRPEQVSLREPNWPPRALQVGYSFQNQFELPMLFYVLVAFILITSTNSLIFVILAWVFVLSRIAHAYIHTGSNEFHSRSAALAVGAIALVAMWVIFAIRILITGA